MKLNIIRDPGCREAEVTLRHAPGDPTARRLARCLNQFSLILDGWDGEECCRVSARDILYLETVDRKTFLYLERKILRSRESLAALERRLEGTAFTRVSKNCLLNTDRLRSVRALLDRKSTRLNSSHRL